MNKSNIHKEVHIYKVQYIKKCIKQSPCTATTSKLPSITEVACFPYSSTSINGESPGELKVEAQPSSYPLCCSDH